MALKIILCSILFTALCSSASIRESVGQWTLSHFSRECDADGSFCHYTFVLDEGKSADPLPCVFSVPGVQGKPANQSDFHGLNCTILPQYSVNGGWSPPSPQSTPDHPDSFITIVPTNVHDNTDAFFSYLDIDIQSGKEVPVQTRPAYRRNSFALSRRSIHSKRSGSGFPNLSLSWSIHGLHRYIDGQRVHMSFDIIDHMNNNATTHVDQDFPAPGFTDPKTCNLYAQQLGDTDWYLSWGSNPEHDSAVMNIANYKKKWDAFFGWEHVNNSTWLGDAGPSLVLEL